MPFNYGDYETLCEHTVPTEGALTFTLPIWEGYCYARWSAETFFKYTPIELNPVCIILDDCSPTFGQQDWDFWYSGGEGGYPLPRDRCIHRYYTENQGLTRSWNGGLAIARDMGAKYNIAGNADILFTPSWERALMHFLDNGADLVGPVTNAPGHVPQQNVKHFFPNYKLGDKKEYLHEVAAYLWEHYGTETIWYRAINGFFTMAKTDTWWDKPFDKNNVFNPKIPMAGNEEELERRWKAMGRKIGFAPGSFVFHYRAVSRGEQFLREGWLRSKDLGQEK